MVFDWRNFLLLAHELRTDHRENVQRTCISRAYYHAFNLGLNKAKIDEYNPKLSPLKKAGEHARLWNWYLTHPGVDLKQMGDIGGTMRARRVEADYKASTRPTLQQDLQKQLDEARAFELLLSQITGQAAPPGLP